MPDADIYYILLKLVAAILLGGAIGVERTVVHKNAGIRTYSLVAMGSALFVVISQLVGQQYTGAINFDPLRVASQIVVGIGFLGAGLIIFQENKLQGLTTAAGLWVAGGVGMAVGFGLFALGLIATLLTLFVFTILWFVEQGVKKVLPEENGR